MKDRDYLAAKKLLPKEAFDPGERYTTNRKYHLQAHRLMDFLVEYDYEECGDSMGWQMGGDGDNGQILLDALSVWFEYLDASSNSS